MASVMRFDQWQDSDGNPVASAVNGVGKILQVVSVIKTDAQAFTSIASGASTAITGLTATITPASATSKIMVWVSVYISGQEQSGQTYLVYPVILKRGATAIGLGDAASNRTRATAGVNNTGQALSGVHFNFLDSPATTSATTYGVDLINPLTATTNLYVNRSFTDTDNINFPRVSSSITVMEVAG